jgi:L-lactate dehydrogenase
MKSCKIQSNFTHQFKVAIVGCGNVGAATAHAMLIEGSPSEIILVDRNKDKAEGLLLDFDHSMSFFDHTKITATDKPEDCVNADLIVVTAGARQQEGETRLDLVEKNKAIFKELIPALVKNSPDAILLIVSNPVDILTYEAWKLSGFPKNRVFGTGTMLDSARLQFHISEQLCMSPKSVDAFVLGEHGDTSFPVWSVANISGKSLLDMDGFGQKEADKCYKDTREAAYRIINDLGYTCYSIATVIVEVMDNLLQHSRAVLPLSTVLEGEYGHKDVALSVPCIIDSDGVAGVLEIPLNAEEKKLLAHSVETLKALL